jgi:hypothetical protein
MHEVTGNSMPNRPLVALGAAFMKLMRIIPDSKTGYSDTLVTVKRYLLAGAASVFRAVGSGTTLSLSPSPYPTPGGRGNRLGTGIAKR